MQNENLIPAPAILPDTAPYWEAANEGRLLLKCCTDCGEVHFYPRDICPHCLSSRTEWFEAQGTGTIYSFSTNPRARDNFIMAYVTLDEGVTMMTNLVDCDPGTLSVGQRVKVVFRPASNGQAVPMFAPVA